MQAGYSRDAAAVNYVSNRLDAFVQLDNVGAELVAKTLHPLMGKTADTNFAETMKFVGQVCHVAETNGPGVQRLTTRLEKVDPNVRARFADIANTINQRAIMREMAAVPSRPMIGWVNLLDQRIGNRPRDVTSAERIATCGCPMIGRRRRGPLAALLHRLSCAMSQLAGCLPNSSRAISRSRRKSNLPVPRIGKSSTCTKLSGDGM